VAEIRNILDRYRGQAEIHLAGIPTIVSDIIRFIWHDLRVFGAAVLSLIVVLLAVAFRSLRWVALPLLICMASAAVMIGALGLLQWPLTVVSSNFLPVLLIITLSLNIHLIVRHEELRGDSGDESDRTLIENTVRSKFLPCLYTALTTMVAFGSLLVSGIRPVIDFGWLMVTGVLLSFALTFLAFPAILRLLPRAGKMRPSFDISGSVTRFLSDLVDGRAVATWR
jgi:predicted RND superfamily exporter protein